MERFAAGRTFAVRGLVSITLIVVLTTAGCGGSGKETVTVTVAAASSKNAGITPVGRGRYGYARGLFKELCAGCHTLADADAHGQRFDLDRVPDLEAGLVWHAIRDGEPGMPPWDERLSEREISALAVYVMNVAKGLDGDDRWNKQINRRTQGETKRWRDIALLIEAELDREGRKAEQPSGKVVPPTGR